MKNQVIHKVPEKKAGYLEVTGVNVFFCPRSPKAVELRRPEKKKERRKNTENVHVCFFLFFPRRLFTGC